MTLVVPELMFVLESFYRGNDPRMLPLEFIRYSCKLCIIRPS